MNTEKKTTNIILTWTNKQSLEYNIAMRRAIFGRSDLKTYEKAFP